MSCTEILKARVSPEIKEQVRSVAERELLTEAAWLKRLVIREVRTVCGEDAGELEPCRVGDFRKPTRSASKSGGCGLPMLVRLRHDDRLLLDARAEARGMRPATYASVLLRAHCAGSRPFPRTSCSRSSAASASSRPLAETSTRLPRVANEGGRMPGSAREEFRAMLKVCEALRENTKALLKANVTSWESGNGEDV